MRKQLQFPKTKNQKPNDYQNELSFSFLSLKFMLIFYYGSRNGLNC